MGVYNFEIGRPYKYVILPLELSGEERIVKALNEAGFVIGNNIGGKFRVLERN